MLINNLSRPRLLSIVTRPNLPDTIP